MTDSSHKARAWAALGLGPLRLVRGPEDPIVLAETGRSVDEVAVVDAAHEVVESTRSDTIGVSPVVQLTPGIDHEFADMNWHDLQVTIAKCTDCGLCEGRTQTVFGVGDEKPRWLIVGEAPGANEDKQGEPFIGEAGLLLNAMLAALGVSRDDGVFILNVLKCRPPDNRDPLPEEIASCSRYLQRQVQLLQPDLILTMGRFAAQTLLNTEKSIGSLRGKAHSALVGEREIPLVVSYHPAYLLRRPEEKSKAWRDLCLARSVFDPARQAP